MQIQPIHVSIPNFACYIYCVSLIMQIKQLPDQAAQKVIAQPFQLSSGFPGIVGVLDGTDIGLAAATGGDSDYINRKGYHSLQLQVR